VAQKEVSPMGDKIRAGMMLTKFLKQIGEEQTELVKNKDGEEILVSRMEALARLIWKCAIGYVEDVTHDDGSKTIHVCAPDRAAWHLIFDRIEGKKIGRASCRERVSCDV
jgi:hypothetical protein